MLASIQMLLEILDGNTANTGIHSLQSARIFSQYEGDPHEAVKVLEFTVLMCLIVGCWRVEMTRTADFSLLMCRAIQFLIAAVVVCVSSSPPERRQERHGIKAKILLFRGSGGKKDLLFEALCTYNKGMFTKWQVVKTASSSYENPSSEKQLPCILSSGK